MYSACKIIKILFIFYGETDNFFIFVWYFAHLIVSLQTEDNL